MDKITRQAIKAAGGASALARSLKLTRQAVSKWDRVPGLHVLKIEELTGISRHSMRPDIFGKAQS